MFIIIAILPFSWYISRMNYFEVISHHALQEPMFRFLVVMVCAWNQHDKILLAHITLSLLPIIVTYAVAVGVLWVHMWYVSKFVWGTAVNFSKCNKNSWWEISFIKLYSLHPLFIFKTSYIVVAFLS